MAIPRPSSGLQNLNQFFRLFLAWCLCWAYGIAIFLLMPFCGPSEAWRRLRLPWARGVLSLLRIELRVHGAEHLTGAAVYICNHMSFIDVVILPALVPKECRLVAKREVLWFPIVGWGFAAGGAVLLDRRQPRLANQRLMESAVRLPKGWSLMIFPEGTRSRDRTLKRFKQGAFSLAIATKLPVVPIALSDTQKIMSTKSFFVRPGIVDVQVGAPIDTSHWRNETLRSHIAEGHNAVAACMRTLEQKG